MSLRILLLPTLFACGVLPVQALNLVVTNPGESGPGKTLRAAVEEASNTPGDDVITFNLPTGTWIIDLFGQMSVHGGDRIKITAEGLSGPVTLSAGGLSRFFLIAADTTLELVNLNLVEGYAGNGADGVSGDEPGAGEDAEHGGAIYNQGGHLILRRCEISDCSAGAGGNGGNKDSVDNPDQGSGVGGRGGSGGAIYSLGGSLWVEDSILSRNSAGVGGFGGSKFLATSGPVGAGGEGGSGGAIHTETSVVEIRNSILADNRAGRGGGGGENEDSSTGGAGGRGGAGGGIGAFAAEIRIVDSTIAGNFAGDGGAGGDVFGDLSDIRGAGGAGGDGGGLWAIRIPTGSLPQIENSLFNQNRAGNGWTGGSSEISTGVVNGTAGGAGGSGGGLYLAGADGAIVKIANSTVIRNFAGEGGSGGSGSTSGAGGAGGDAGNGGGIALWRETGDYSVELIHASVLANEAIGPGPGGQPAGAATGAASSGGGIWEVAGGIRQSGGPGLTLANSVVAINSAGSVPNVVNFAEQGMNFTSGDPKVNDLLDNGGPTRTVAPLQGSPLLDAGAALTVPLTTDQRGRARPFNGTPDIGAFEARLQVDARIGASSNPATHRIDNRYTSSGAGQTLSVRLPVRGRKLFHLSVQNDGEIADNLRLSGSRANGTLVVSVFRLTGGRANVTGRLSSGFPVSAVNPGSTVVFQVDVRARSKTKQARQVLSYRVGNSVPGMVDVVKASVLGPKPKKVRKK